MQMKSPANLASMLPQDDPLRQAVTLQQKIEGAGSIAPLAIVMRFSTTVTNQATWMAVSRVTQAIKPLPEVKQIASPTQLGLSPASLSLMMQHPQMTPSAVSQALKNFIVPQRDPHLVVLYVTAKSGPDTQASAQLSETINHHLSLWLPAHTRAATGGLVPMLQSFNQLTSSRLPIILIAVALVALVVLAIATGSLLQALLGVLLDGLVALATAGFLYLVVQTGHLGFSPSPPDSSITPLIFVLLFGLSMDYEVILLHRIQEPLKAGQFIREAVRLGVGTTGSMITGAGMIMVVVFLALLVSPLEVMKTISIGLTFAVLMDTWVVRTLLVPSITVLLGRYAYWPWGDQIQP
jgi:RND superfamily putative drug exporter